MGCNYCCGDEAVFYKDNENCVFVGMNGEMLAIAKDRSIRFKVPYCPMCGRKFVDAKYLNLKKGDDIYYADKENNKVEHGKIFSIYIKDGKVDTFSIDFDCGDFDEFSGGGLGVHYFTSKNDAEKALKR